jgi:hypothetical protein
MPPMQSAVATPSVALGTTTGTDAKAAGCNGVEADKVIEN